jgi:ring-1,2-phenylacetyl-CoA epoxidase subunit PaaD
MAPLSEAAIWHALESVKDPEIPVVSVVEMGIVREVTVDGGQVIVKMTPTFSGCPALDVMRRDIAACVRRLGATDVVVETVLSPPWTTDWLSDDTRARLKAFGLSPPPRHGGTVPITFYEPVPCPYCDSEDTEIKNSFGSTLCRAIYYCRACQQPFEQFKAL